MELSPEARDALMMAFIYAGGRSEDMECFEGALIENLEEAGLVMVISPKGEDKK